ncbi:MAG: glycosyl hydrolase, partial [Thermoanaerobaculia bacterium]
MKETRCCRIGFVRWIPALFLIGVVAITPVFAVEEEETPFDHLEWRNIGPVNMSGRVADVEGIPGNPNVLYVGSASGGVWKTVDGGLTFKPLFDEQPIASIGDLALAPSNPDVIYVGSGEANARNSVSFGNGVYKSTDGGQSWTHVGLENTRHISRVLVSPLDPDVVFVGAMGSFWGPNEERGVFRSTDGGATWEKVLYLDDKHGVSDMDIDPTNPNILFAGLWHFDRKPWTHTTGSEEGGVWKSVDGGDTWERLEEGLPEGVVGRIGVKIAPSNPEVVYVIAESDEGTLFRSDNRGKEFKKVSDNVQIVSRGLYYTDMRVDPGDENRVYAVSSRLFLSVDGGKNFDRISQSTHVDFHSLWIDPENSDRLWQGQDGGVAVSYDRGKTWEPIRNLPLAQFYQVFHDNREPFYVVGGGLQDNGTWYGPSRTREPAGILPDDWRMMSFGDAYWVVPHPTQEDLFLSESQAGNIVRTDMRTRQQIDVSPQPRRNDGGPVEALEYRFNWNAPIVYSPHDPMTVYFAGNVIFKTQDFGDTWEKISPDLTTDDPDKQGEAGGPAWTENTTAEYHCTIISFAESPVEAGVLWSGSDDGLLYVSRDGGENWTNVIGNVSGMPEFSPVSHIEASRTDAGTAFAAFDRHMFDDLHPHIYKTTDFGQTWSRVSTEGIPDQAWVWIVREDPRNTDLLWAGTELGLYASYDSGGSWQQMHLKNLPTVAIHDILVHPRENDLILGTHGRAIWIFDDATPLQQFSDEVAAEKAALFEMRPAIRFPTRFTRYGLGDKSHRAPNPPAGALITYFLQEKIEEEKSGKEGEDGEDAVKPDDAEEKGKKEERIKIEILDSAGEVIRTLDGEKLGKEAGLNRVAWNLAADPARPRNDEKPEPSFFRPEPRGPMVLPGTYTVRLTVDGESHDQPVEVGVDPM